MTNLTTFYRQAAFTLMELMIVVAIIGLLSAIAIPSYDSYTRKARRADAQASLLELAQFMERHYTNKGSYYDSGTTPPTLPYTESPKDGGAKFYDLRVNLTNSENYTLQAVPKNAMAGDDCGTLTLNSNGVKGQGSGGTLSLCWRR